MTTPHPRFALRSVTIFFGLSQTFIQPCLMIVNFFVVCPIWISLFGIFFCRWHGLMTWWRKGAQKTFRCTYNKHDLPQNIFERFKAVSSFSILIPLEHAQAAQLFRNQKKILKVYYLQLAKEKISSNRFSKPSTSAKLGMTHWTLDLAKGLKLISPLSR